jgi:hypothetical protein
MSLWGKAKMKTSQLLKILFLAIFSSASFATKYSNQSFMKPRAPGREMPIEQATWYHAQRNADNRVGAASGSTVQVAAFYKRSYEEDSLGGYFGIRGKNSITYDRPTTTKFAALGSEDFIHTTETLKGELTLKPKRIVEGLKLNLYKNFNDGYFGKVNLPILRVKHHLHPKVENEVLNNGAGILELFGGEYSSETLDKAQKKLLNSKISSTENKGTFGLGDVDLIFGRRLMDEETFDISAYAKITVPTSNEPTGEFLFEPIRGNGKHFEVGAGIISSADMWQDSNSSMELMVQLESCYIFQSDEKRSFNGVADFKVTPPWSRYSLTGTKGQTGSAPFANYSTISAKVAPGFKLEGLIDVGYRQNSVTIDAGYNFYAQEGEKITIKNWTDDKYAFIKAYSTDGATGYETSKPFEIKTAHLMGAIEATAINSDELETNNAASPAYLTHTIFVSVGYLGGDKISSMAAVGAAYEWSRENSGISGIMLWLKGGFCF